MKNQFYKAKDESDIEFIKTRKECFIKSITDDNISGILSKIESYISLFNYNKHTYSLLKSFFLDLRLSIKNNSFTKFEDYSNTILTYYKSMLKTDFYNNDLDREKNLLKDFFEKFTLKLIEIQITNNKIDIDHLIDFCIKNSAQNKTNELENPSYTILNKFV
ncbi:MAG: hypothetical protein LEGION0398_MBIBDBAK_00271 [Legionellaceae bacterium]